MGRFHLLSIFLLLPLLFSVGHAALTFHDIWNLALPHRASPAETAPDHLPHEELRSTLPTTLPTAGEAGDHRGAGDAIEHSKARVDFGTKAWPYIYYARRDREGTVDWGTKSWPYIFYSEKDEREGLAASSDAGAGSDVYYGRKAGHGFRI